MEKWGNSIPALNVNTDKKTPHISAPQTIQTPELHTCRFAIRRKIRGTIPSARTARLQSTKKKSDGDSQGIGSEYLAGAFARDGEENSGNP